ncbi:hypothetical protein [Rudaea sp.]|uniref:hypothetical protein n=1 Tax=Rudaea sp. TaxID=2136325 RepID=UPI002ED5F1ED
MRNDRTIFARRLREELKRQKFDSRPVALVKALAREGGVSVAQQTISHWLHAKHLPRIEAMHGLSKMLGMDAYSLLREAEPLRVQEPRMLWPEHVSGPDRLTFEAFLSLPVKEQKTVQELIASLALPAAARKLRGE